MITFTPAVMRCKNCEFLSKPKIKFLFYLSFLSSNELIGYAVHLNICYQGLGVLGHFFSVPHGLEG